MHAFTFSKKEFFKGQLEATERLSTCENPNYSQMYVEIWKKGLLGLFNSEPSEYSKAFSHLYDPNSLSQKEKEISFKMPDGETYSNPLEFSISVDFSLEFPSVTLC